MPDICRAELLPLLRYAISYLLYYYYSPLITPLRQRH